MPPEGTLSPDIQAAVDLAERSDVAVVVAGLWDGESRDRGELDLPTDQDELIDAVSRAEVAQVYAGTLPAIRLTATARVAIYVGSSVQD